MPNPKQSTSKTLLMFTLLCVDLGINSSFDYDLIGSNEPDFYVVLLGIQVVVELSIFFALFLAMAETFLFRVGLLGILIKKFRLVLLLHPMYLAFTLASGVLRVRKLTSDSGHMVALWKDSTFEAISIIHKMGTYVLHLT